MIKKCTSALCFAFIILSSSSLAQVIGDDYLKKQYKQGNKLLDDNKFQEALPLLTEVCKSYRDNSNVNYKVATCYFNIEKERSKAIPYFLKAVKFISPGGYSANSYEEVNAPAEAYFYLASSYQQSNDLNKAVIYYSLYLVKAPKGKLAGQAQEKVNESLKAKQQKENQYSSILSNDSLFRNFSYASNDTVFKDVKENKTIEKKQLLEVESKKIVNKEKVKELEVENDVKTGDISAKEAEKIDKSKIRGTKEVIKDSIKIVEKTKELEVEKEVKIGKIIDENGKESEEGSKEKVSTVSVDAGGQITRSAGSPPADENTKALNELISEYYKLDDANKTSESQLAFIHKNITDEATIRKKIETLKKYVSVNDSLLKSSAQQETSDQNKAIALLSEITVLKNRLKVQKSVESKIKENETLLKQKEPVEKQISDIEKDLLERDLLKVEKLRLENELRRKPALQRQSDSLGLITGQRPSVEAKITAIQKEVVLIAEIRRKIQAYKDIIDQKAPLESTKDSLKQVVATKPKIEARYNKLKNESDKIKSIENEINDLITYVFTDPPANIEEYKSKIAQGDKFLEMKEYYHSLQIWLELLKSFPNNGNFNYKAGVCLFYANESKQRPGALPYLIRAVKNYSPKYSKNYKETKAPADAYYYLGGTFNLLGDYSNAVLNYAIYSSLKVGSKDALDVSSNMSECIRNIDSKKGSANLSVLALFDSLKIDYTSNFGQAISEKPTQIVISAKNFNSDFTFINPEDYYTPVYFASTKKPDGNWAFPIKLSRREFNIFKQNQAEGKETDFAGLQGKKNKIEIEKKISSANEVDVIEIVEKEKIEINETEVVTLKQVDNEKNTGNVTAAEAARLDGVNVVKEVKKEKIREEEVISFKEKQVIRDMGIISVIDRKRVDSVTAVRKSAQKQEEVVEFKENPSAEDLTKLNKNELQNRITTAKAKGENLQSQLAASYDMLAKSAMLKSELEQLQQDTLAINQMQKNLKNIRKDTSVVFKGATTDTLAKQQFYSARFIKLEKQLTQLKNDASVLEKQEMDLAELQKQVVEFRNSEKKLETLKAEQKAKKELEKQVNTLKLRYQDVIGLEQKIMKQKAEVQLVVQLEKKWLDLKQQTLTRPELDKELLALEKQVAAVNALKAEINKLKTDALAMDELRFKAEELETSLAKYIGLKTNSEQLVASIEDNEALTKMLTGGETYEHFIENQPKALNAGEIPLMVRAQKFIQLKANIKQSGMVNETLDFSNAKNFSLDKKVFLLNMMHDFQKQLNEAVAQKLK